jgi:hypothetical protein
VGEGRAPGTGQRHQADGGQEERRARGKAARPIVLALLEAYPRLGRPLFPRNTWRQSLVGDEFTDISQELTTALLRSAGRCPLDELSDIAYHAIEARYMLTGLTALQHDSLRRTIAVDVTIAMAALHVLGVVVLDHEADSAGLTDLGRYAIRRVRGMAQPGDPVLRMRITLVGVDGPPVWRQVVIPAGYTSTGSMASSRPRWGGRTLTCTCSGSPTGNTAPRTWTMSSRRSTRSSSGSVIW